MFCMSYKNIRLFRHKSNHLSHTQFVVYCCFENGPKTKVLWPVKALPSINVAILTIRRVILIDCQTVKVEHITLTLQAVPIAVLILYQTVFCPSDHDEKLKRKHCEKRRKILVTLVDFFFHNVFFGIIDRSGCIYNF